MIVKSACTRGITHFRVSRADASHIVVHDDPSIREHAQIAAMIGMAVGDHEEVDVVRVETLLIQRYHSVI
jgi:hypothetical protein